MPAPPHLLPLTTVLPAYANSSFSALACHMFAAIDQADTMQEKRAQGRGVYQCQRVQEVQGSLIAAAALVQGH